MTAPASVRLRLLCNGLVQGVGFRPFVYRLATAERLGGGVQNTARGVVVEIEGEPEALARFRVRLESELPPLARLDSVAEEGLAARGETRFAILESEGGRAATLIPADVDVCAACLAELRDPADRRHGYPFINCTDCGPRFTIIAGVPYDRAQTTMRAFALCPACQEEYEDPTSRRFHAEPNACPACGPRVWLAGADGAELAGPSEAIAAAARRLAGGAILAVKGLGGFHLAVSATDEGAVARLRQRKGRDGKPFAVMVADLETARRFASPGRVEEAMLRSRERPVVLCDAGAEPLAPGVAPGLRRVGIFLPYTPLHHLLLEEAAAAAVPALVLTSANLRDEPIVRGNEEARARLGAIADGYLFHDRDILARADDSVGLAVAGAPLLLRRSRGYTPVAVPCPPGPVVLAVGGDKKNAFVLTRGREAFFGPHVGDLENAASSEYFDEAVAHLGRLLDVQPEVVACDLHPDYASTRAARRIADALGVPLVAVQHHHAHILSCLAENRALGPVLGLAIDGTGHGLDGTSWGGEILLVDGVRCERLARLEPLALPGGDRATREIWRIAAAALLARGEAALLERLRFPSARPDVCAALPKLLESAPRASGLGRLFDAVAAVAGVTDIATYEGEAAIRLEQAAVELGDPYAFPQSGGAARPGAAADSDIAVLGGPDLVVAAARDAVAGVPASVISARFHAALVEGFTVALRAAGRRAGVGVVAISGGAAANRLLVDGLSERLVSLGIRVLRHSLVPAGDGGLALGQAGYALEKVNP